MGAHTRVPANASSSASRARPLASGTQAPLLADAEPQNCDGSRPSAVERFQVYPGEARGGEQASPVAEQDRQDEHHDLVHESPPQALTGYVGAEDFEVLAGRGAERDGDGETAAVVPRTTTSEIHRYKADTTDKRLLARPAEI